eukprot:7116984-Pyramimonas_sp.AAC.1
MRIDPPVRDTHLRVAQIRRAGASRGSRGGLEGIYRGYTHLRVAQLRRAGAEGDGKAKNGLLHHGRAVGVDTTESQVVVGSEIQAAAGGPS